MKIAVIGGGPAGLYFAILSKRRFPEANIQVYEQNPKGATFGFGIVLADRGLGRMLRADAESCEAILKSCYMTRNQLISHRGQSILVERDAFGGAISRFGLLQVLESFCIGLGIPLHYQIRVHDMARFADCDLVIGADGANSAVREANKEAFGATSWNLTNRLVWCGTTRRFAQPILTFKTTEYGHFWAVGYPYSDSMSTLVGECDADAWVRSGMSNMSDEERLEFTERIFADELQGHALLSNKSIWRALPVTRNRNWYVGKFVLIGDALHSAHPSIGSGTRIAMEDAIDLAETLKHQEGYVPAALAEFEFVLRPSKQKIVGAAEQSFMWYEDVASKMDMLEPVQLVFSYLTRTDRVDEKRLLQEFPQFMAKHRKQWVSYRAATKTEAEKLARNVTPIAAKR